MTTVNIETNKFSTKNDQTFKVGDFLLVDGELTIISQVDYNKVCILSIKDSNRYEDPIYVLDKRNIPYVDIVKMAGEEVSEIISVKSVSIKVEI